MLISTHIYAGNEWFCKFNIDQNVQQSLTEFFEQYEQTLKTQDGSDFLQKNNFTLGEISRPLELVYDNPGFGLAITLTIGRNLPPHFNFIQPNFTLRYPNNDKKWYFDNFSPSYEHFVSVYFIKKFLDMKRLGGGDNITLIIPAGYWGEEVSRLISEGQDIPEAMRKSANLYLGLQTLGFDYNSSKNEFSYRVESLNNTNPNTAKIAPIKVIRDPKVKLTIESPTTIESTTKGDSLFETIFSGLKETQYSTGKHIIPIANNFEGITNEHTHLHIIATALVANKNFHMITVKNLTLGSESSESETAKTPEQLIYFFSILENNLPTTVAEKTQFALIYEIPFGIDDTIEGQQFDQAFKQAGFIKVADQYSRTITVPTSH